MLILQYLRNSKYNNNNNNIVLLQYDWNIKLSFGIPHTIIAVCNITRYAPFQCLVTDHALAHEFNELAEEMSLTDVDGELCHIEEEEEEEHGHEEEMHAGGCGCLDS